VLSQVLRLLGLPEADLKLITKDKNAAQIHVSFMGKTFLPEVLRERIADTQWTHVVAFRPTGNQSYRLNLLHGTFLATLSQPIACPSSCTRAKAMLLAASLLLALNFCGTGCISMGLGTLSWKASDLVQKQR